MIERESSKSFCNFQLRERKKSLNDRHPVEKVSMEIRTHNYAQKFQSWLQQIENIFNGPTPVSFSVYFLYI